MLGRTLIHGQQSGSLKQILPLNWALKVRDVNTSIIIIAFPLDQRAKNLPAVQETWFDP